MPEAIARRMLSFVFSFRASVSAVGYSVSAGYAMKQPDQTLDDAVRESDQNMYLEKAEYYRKCEAEQAALPTV